MYKKVLVIGSGPIIIGQAAEFDYSGTQACRVLKEEGVEVVLVNNNPATIMTDKTVADIVYSEPLTLGFLERIIDKERPDGILASVGGQTALNLAVDLQQAGVLDRYQVAVLGSSIETIIHAEDRSSFKSIMTEINQPCIESFVAHNLEEAKAYVAETGFPVVVRPAFTLGGTGGGFCYNMDHLYDYVTKGLLASPAGQVLIEKSIKGWKEIEYEMVRDHKGNCIVVCNMENFDPVGIHTGDSIVVAPSLTLPDEQYQMLRRASIDIVDRLGIKGACNVQLALDPKSDAYYVIEVNPRVSRSSALASKATGYPIAKVATKIGLGYALDEITNDVTQKTKACFEPALDYCALKIPKWPFAKFKDASKTLGTQMQATGEVMAIGHSFEAALLKGIRSLEIDQEGLVYKKAYEMVLEDLLENLVQADDERLFYMAELLRRQVSPLKIQALTSIELFFINKVKRIVDLEEALTQKFLRSLSEADLRHLKQLGFSDRQISDLLLDSNKDEVRDYRKGMGVLPSYKMVDTCAGEFQAASPYYYSSYDQYSDHRESQKEKVLVIGSGPITIGQGVEFDYCSVHGIYALQDQGYEAILINNNPETVSTDFDVADRLYFEPLTLEDVLNVIDLEKPMGVILQYGGQTAVKLAKGLWEKGVRILGTGYKGIDKTEDRWAFNDLMTEIGIDQPKGGLALDKTSLLEEADRIGFPLLLRPNYVIGGEGMKIYYSKESLIKDFDRGGLDAVLVDQYLEGLEIEVDCISDGQDVLLPGIMEHLERAGVHSGDSSSIYPSQNISQSLKEEILLKTQMICRRIQAVGLVNIQYVYYKHRLYVIEVNPRASRTIPFLSKVTGVPMVDLSCQVMMGKKLKDLGYGLGLYREKNFVAIKTPIFSMEKIVNGDLSLGPLMKSTGEIMSIDENFDKAMKKSMVARGIHRESKGVFLSVCDEKKEASQLVMKQLKTLGYKIYATRGTHHFLQEEGIASECVDKVSINDDIFNLINRGAIDMIINIPSQKQVSTSDGFKIRRKASESGLLCYTVLDTVAAKLAIHLKDIKEETLEIIDICLIK